MSASSLVRRRGGAGVARATVEHFPALTRRYATAAEDRARVEVELAAARRARSPYVAYLEGLLESPDPQVAHAVYVARLEAEAADLRRRLAEVTR
ncbi:hypothetical protein [Streptacidiphilus sp. PAMC 29251]